MMMKRLFLILLFGLSIMLVVITCDKNPSEPKPTIGTIQGNVKSILPGNSTAIHPAYIIVEDRLLATTDENGNYVIASIEEGTYQLTCSALNYRDSTEQVSVLGGKTINHDFYLTPDSSIGRVYGEFQDVTLFNQRLQADPSLAQWDAKKIFDAATGATVQAKTFGYEIPNRKVFLGDSLLAISDVWGQYWFKIQCGTYPITGSCEGYYDSTQVIKVLPDARSYVNFFLRRK
jgi:hypothetical protein